jgi:hypothetical protein
VAIQSAKNSAVYRCATLSIKCRLTKQKCQDVKVGNRIRLRGPVNNAIRRSFSNSRHLEKSMMRNRRKHDTMQRRDDVARGSGPIGYSVDSTKKQTNTRKFLRALCIYVAYRKSFSARVSSLPAAIPVSAWVPRLTHC